MIGLRKLTAILFTVLITLPIPYAATAQTTNTTSQLRVVHYDLDINVTPPLKQISISGTATFKAPHAKFDSIELILDKAMGDLTLTVIQPPQLKTSTVTRTQGAQNSYVLKFPSPVSSGTNITMKFSYDGKDEGEKREVVANGTAFYIDQPGALLGGSTMAWYPQFKILDLKENPFDDVMLATGQLTYTVPGDYSVAVLGGNMLGPPVKNGGAMVFRYGVDTPSFLTSTVGKYFVREIKDTITIKSFTLKNRDNSTSIMKKSSEILSHLGNIFGAYPHKNFSIIEFPDEMSQRMGIGGESDLAGILMPSSSFDKDFNLALWGHELSHQWWGNLVRIKGDYNKGSKGIGMLDEAMAQFGSLMVVESFEGTRMAETFRRRGYPGYGTRNSGFGYLNYAAAGQDAPLSRMPLNTIHNLADGKGFLVYDLLADTIGRGNFFQALKSITRKYAYNSLTWEEFLGEVQSKSSADLSWFYHQWFERAGAPEWDYTWNQKGSIVSIVIKQTAPYYRIDNVEIVVIESDTKRAKFVGKIAGPETVLTLPVNFSAKEVSVDPHFKILHWEPTYKKEAYDLLVPSKVNSLRGAGKLAEAEKMCLDALKKIPPSDPFGVEFSLYYEMARIRTAQEKYDEALYYFTRALQCPSRVSDLLPWAYFRVAEIAAKQNKDELFEWAASSAIKADEITGKKAGMEQQVKSLMAERK